MKIHYWSKNSDYETSFETCPYENNYFSLKALTKGLYSPETNFWYFTSKILNFI